MANFVATELDSGAPFTASFVVPSGSEMGSGGTAPKNAIAPVVSGLDPPAGSTIEPDDVISFDVTDDVGAFARIFVTAKDLDSGVEEVVHDGDSFNGFYITGSTRSLITGGIHYQISRRGGWSGSRIEISAFAIDEDGNEGTL